MGRRLAARWMLGAAICLCALPAEAQFLSHYDDGDAGTFSHVPTGVARSTDPGTSAEFSLVTFATTGGNDFVRIDEDGSVAWHRQIDMVVNDIAETSTPGTFIVIGGVWNGVGYRPTALTIDHTGAVGWANRYIHNPDPMMQLGDVFFSVHVDGPNFVIVGFKDYLEGTNDSSDMWMVKLDSAGDILWQNAIGYFGNASFEHNEEGRGVSGAANGNYMFVGTGQSTNENPSFVVMLVEVDSAGALVGERKVFTTLNGDEGFDIAYTGTSHVVAGTQNDNPMMFEIGAGNTLTWAKRFDLGYNVFTADIALTTNHYFFSGWVAQNAAPILKVATNGNLDAHWNLDTNLGVRTRIVGNGDSLLAARGAQNDPFFTFGTLDAAGALATACTSIGTTGASTEVDPALTVLPSNFGGAGRYAPTAVVATPLTPVVDSPTSFSATGVCNLATTLDATPSMLTFSTLDVGDSESLNVTLSALNGDIAISSMTVGDPAHFAVASTTCGALPATLTGGQSCSVSVDFQPTAGGEHTSTLDIASDASGSPTSVSITGTGVAPVGRNLDISTTEIDFAAEAGSQSLTLSSDSALPVRVSRIGVDEGGDFSITGGDCPDSAFSLPPETSCSVEVTFEPQDDGPFSGTLTIESDDDDEPVQTVALVSEALPDAGLTFVPAESFEALAPATLSSAKVQRIEITNASQAPTRLYSVSVGGDDNFITVTSAACLGALEAAGGEGIVIKPGESCFFSVAFVPGAVGTFNAEVSATGDSDIAPLTLTGVATAAGDPDVDQGCAVSTSRPRSANWSWLAMLAALRLTLRTRSRRRRAS